ncbi:hypothetical protein RD792_007939 [Penstemon davidsonii]|uniref:Uncharacterized protein n=1 Tax=Penstemon davidsonii TaxID=160366 RepID=A0ABR0D7Q0_9LAMI|nr:hypothetical protein RD792_007939 [Penstemon davidsonii]
MSTSIAMSYLTSVADPYVTLIVKGQVELSPNHVSGLSPIHVMNSNMVSEPRCAMDLISTVFLCDGRRLKGKKTPDEVELSPNHVSGLCPIRVMNSNMVSEPRCAMDLISTVFLFDGRRLQGKKTSDEVELGPNHVSGLSPIHVMNSNMVSEPRLKWVTSFRDGLLLVRMMGLQYLQTHFTQITKAWVVIIPPVNKGPECLYSCVGTSPTCRKFTRCAMDLISTVFLFDGRRLQGKKTPDEVMYSFSSLDIRVIIIFDYGCAMDLISTVFLFDGRRLQGKKTPDEVIYSFSSHDIRVIIIFDYGCAMDLISTVFLFDGRRLQGKKTPDEVELGPNHVSGLSPIHVMNSNMVSEPRCAMDLISTVFLFDGRRLQGKKTPDEVIYSFSSHDIRVIISFDYGCAMDLISTVFLFDGRRLQGKKTPDEVIYSFSSHDIRVIISFDYGCAMDLISTVFLFDGRRLQGKKTPDEVIYSFSSHDIRVIISFDYGCAMDLISTVFLFDGRRLQGKKTPDEVIYSFSSHDIRVIISFDYGCAVDLISTVFLFDGRRLQGKKTPDEVELGPNHVSGLSPIHVMNSNMVSEPRCAVDLISTVFLFDGRRLQGKKTPDEVELGPNHVSGLSPIHVMNSNMVSEPRCAVDLISTVFLFDGRRLQGKKTPDEVELGPNHVSGLSPIHVMNSNMVSEPRCAVDLISTVFLFDGRRLQGKKTPDEVELGPNHVSGLSPIHVMNSNMVSEPRCAVDLISTVFLFDGRRLQGKKTPDEVELGPNHVSGLSPIHVMNSNMVSEPRCAVDLISTVFLFDGRRLQGKKTPDEVELGPNHVSGLSPIHVMNSNMVSEPRCAVDLISTVFLFDGRRLQGKKTPDEVELGPNHVSGLSPIHVMNSNMVSEPRCAMDLISTVFLFDGRRLQGKKTPDEVIYSFSSHDIRVIISFDYGCAVDLISTVFLFDGRRLQGKKTPDEVELGPNHVSGLSPIHVMNSNMVSEPRCAVDLISTVFLFDGRRLKGKKTPDEEIEDGNEIDALLHQIEWTNA